MAKPIMCPNELSELQQLPSMKLWTESIRLNNLAVRHILNGQLKEALDCLSLASQLNDEASYDSSVEGCGIYRNRWLCLQKSYQSIPVYSQNQDRLKNLFSSVLTIDDDDDDGTFERDVSVLSETERREAVYASRLDWIIEFNLAMVHQLISIVCISMTGRNDTFPSQHQQQSYNLYQQVASDLLEWNDHATTLDVAIFLMAIYNNQGWLCMSAGKQDLATVFLGRVYVISSSCGHLLLSSNSSCHTILLRNAKSIKCIQSHTCAPMA